MGKDIFGPHCLTLCCDYMVWPLQKKWPQSLALFPGSCTSMLTSCRSASLLLWRVVECFGTLLPPVGQWISAHAIDRKVRGIAHLIMHFDPRAQTGEWSL